MRSSITFVAGAATALVLGTGTAYAATGGTFVLGHANRAGTATSLTNPNGTALSLHSKAGVPSLRVVEFPRIKGGKAFDPTVAWFTGLLDEVGQPLGTLAPSTH